jgi:hypothetical protein
MKYILSFDRIGIIRNRYGKQPSESLAGNLLFPVVLWRSYIEGYADKNPLGNVKIRGHSDVPYVGSYYLDLTSYSS